MKLPSGYHHLNNTIPHGHGHRLPSSPDNDSDQTQYSTSFDDIDDDNNSWTALSDTEVDSKSSPFDEFGREKKALTSHWRNFIRPVMCRIKWAELKIRQLESQALTYDKMIAEEASKQSIPQGSKLMKRRKRVRVEDTTDAELYMSTHILFSYHESSKSDPDGKSMTHDPEAVFTTSQEEHNRSLVDDKDDDDMVRILGKIDIAQNMVHKLRGKLDLVNSTCNGGAGGSYASTREFDSKHAVSQSQIGGDS